MSYARDPTTPSVLSAPSQPGVPDRLRAQQQAPPAPPAAHNGLEFPIAGAASSTPLGGANDIAAGPRAHASAHERPRHPLETQLAAQRQAASDAGARAGALPLPGVHSVGGANAAARSASEQRRLLELAAMRAAGWKPAQLRACVGGDGVLGVHEAIRAGRDEYIEWEDVIADDPFAAVPDFHSELETRHRIMR